MSLASWDEAFSNFHCLIALDKPARTGPPGSDLKANISRAFHFKLQDEIYEYCWKMQINLPMTYKLGSYPMMLDMYLDPT